MRFNNASYGRWVSSSGTYYRATSRSFQHPMGQGPASFLHARSGIQEREGGLIFLIERYEIWRKFSSNEITRSIIIVGFEFLVAEDETRERKGSYKYGAMQDRPF